mgnify:CR=1 FL=1
MSKRAWLIVIAVVVVALYQAQYLASAPQAQGVEVFGAAEGAAHHLGLQRAFVVVQEVVWSQQDLGVARLEHGEDLLGLLLVRGRVIEHGERLAQVILNRFEKLPWTRGIVGHSTDRQGGFGSTGHA